MKARRKAVLTKVRAGANRRHQDLSNDTPASPFNPHVKVVAFLFIAIAACTGSPTPAAAVSPTAPATGTPTPPMVNSPTPVNLNLSCRLPVTWTPSTRQTSIVKAGFVTFPGQSLSEDATAPAGSIFYDRALSKWLPVPRSNVSPDGKRYAYSEILGNAYVNSGSKLHVVDVATGVDSVIYNGSSAYNVVDFAADGIYLTAAVPEGYSRGLWVEALAGGTPALISGSIIAPTVGDGAAWGIDFNSADPNPGPGGLESPKNEVLRFDLRTHASTTWFYRPGASIFVLGFDRAGGMFVSAGLNPTPAQGNEPTQELWLVNSPTSARRLLSGTGLLSLARVAAVDNHGVWFDAPYASSSTSTVWLYTGGSIQVAATLDAGDLAIAGGCIP